MKKIHLFVAIIQSFSFFLITYPFIGCTGRNSSKNNINEKQKSVPASPVQYKKPPASFNDTLIIDSKSAVFYNPDSLQLNKIKAVSKKEIFETDVHNCFYLMRNARIVMKRYWSQIKIIETSRARYLLFIKSDKSKICIDLNTENDMCGMFLFDTKKDPELIDMMNIDTALGFYFKK
jgi:hypothetical protein